MPEARHTEDTVTVTLLGGLIVGDRRLDQAELRPLTGHEEAWLARQRAAPSALTTSRLLAACLVGLDGAVVSDHLVRQLLVGDRDYLILALRRLTLGDRFQGVLPCPACDARMDIGFSADEIPIERRPQPVIEHTLEVGPPAEPARTIRFRLPTGGDQEAVLGLDLPAAVDDLLQRCIVDDGGATLSAADREAIAAAMDRLAPQVDLELELTCPECGHGFEAPFDLTTFFFHEMAIDGAQLLQETHALALAYHWSERDILSLARDRRRAYLSLLRDTWSRD
jgi:hypothetical protein